MSVVKWLMRCAPGFSFILLLIFLESVLGVVRSGNLSRGHLLGQNGALILYGVYICYSLLLHLIAFAFPVRLCWAAWCAASRIHATCCQDAIKSTDTVDLCEDGTSVRQDETTVTMAIIIPSYKEDFCVLEDTLNVLASHRLAKTRYDIYLAMEQRDPNGEATAEQLVKAFEHRFFRMQSTIHPVSIEGEVPGKSSNISWAAKEIERVYKGSPNWKDVLITVMDSDTHLLSSYFEHIASSRTRNRGADVTVDMNFYMPPIIFDRNADLVPRLVRVADMMWSGAGLSCFQSKPTTSGIAIPTSVYTIPLPLAELTGGWDCGPQAIGEDMHMLLKCYFATFGRLVVESVPSPASQCNVTTGIKGARGYIADLNARYNQGLRHMWGCLDTGFVLEKWSSLKTSSKAASTTSADNEKSRPFTSLRPRKLSNTDLQLKLSQYALDRPASSRVTRRNIVLFMRMFEAHFLPVHLLLLLIASSTYAALIKSSDEHYIIQFCLGLTGWLRTVSYVTMIFYFAVVYERYHGICVLAREKEMTRAGLHEELSGQFSHRRRYNPSRWLDWLIFPIAGIIFGSIPLLQAAFLHFWTDKLVYLVSAKPKRPISKMMPGLVV